MDAASNLSANLTTDQRPTDPQTLICFHIYYVPVSTAMRFKTFSFFNVDTIPRDIALKSVINYFMFHSLLSSTFSWINNTHYMLYISAIKIVLLFGFPTWKSNPEWTLVLLVCKVMCVINLELDRVVEEGGKVEQILKDTLLSIPSPSPSVKIKIMGVKVCLRCKGKTFLGVINKLFVFKSLLTMPSNVLLLHLKHTLPPIIWIFTEGDGIESMLPFKVFSTLNRLFCIFQGDNFSVL